MSSALLPRRLLALPFPRSLPSAPPRLLSRHASTHSPLPRLSTPRAASAQHSISRREFGTCSPSRAAGLTDTAREVAKDAAASISGANAHTSQFGQAFSGGAKEVKETLELGERTPQGAVVFGAAGLLPYAGTAVGTVYLAREASAAVTGTGGQLDAETALAMLYYVELLQIQYGAIILSFLGAIHWGLEFASFGGEKGSPRYLLGIAPVMAGWTSLLLAPQLALILQWASFLSMWLADQRATKAGWTPSWYSTYRTYLSVVVLTTILVSLVGGNYYGPGSKRVAQNGGRWKPSVEGEISKVTIGDVKVEKADEAFVKILKVEEEGEIKQEKEKEG